jgi:hypothetical protein
MSDITTEQDSVPEITLRIPGPWASPEEFRKALAKADTGYTIQTGLEAGSEAFVAHHATGRRFRLAATERDDEIVELFAGSGRMAPKEIKALKNHKVKVFLSGPGGSLEAARAFLAVGAAVIKAGGLGVMVDNCGNCHSPRDWLALAGDKQMGGMYWAFVSVTASEEEVFSAGMHCLGFRDAELPDPDDSQTSGMMMHEFLGYTYQSGAAIVDGDPIGSPAGPEFILRHVPCTRFPKNSPWYNPYGVWRLEKFKDESENEE